MWSWVVANPSNRPGANLEGVIVQEFVDLISQALQLGVDVIEPVLQHGCVLCHPKL